MGFHGRVLGVWGVGGSSFASGLQSLGKLMVKQRSAVYFVGRFLDEFDHVL